MTTVLIIEDEMPVRENIIDLLDAEGFTCFGAENGERGLFLAQEQHPDLIVCDISLPDMNGYGILSRVQQDKFLSGIPFIFLTARSERTEMRKGMELGADDYITKPYTRAELLRAIQTQMDKRKNLSNQVSRRLDTIHARVERTLPFNILTQLNKITNLAITMQGSQFHQNELTAIAEDIEQAANILQRAIQKYIFFQELERKKAENQKNNFENGKYCSSIVIREAVEMLARQAGRETDLKMVVDDHAFILVGEESVFRIVEEIIENALKYSKPGTAISVSSEALWQKGSYFFHVKNIGTPISRDRIQILNEFIDLDHYFPDQNSVGLGLLIARRLAILYGGFLSIQSAQDGTIVEITLPLAVHPPEINI
jgi:two-component system, sensor histidine kinase and response regulator